MRDDGRLVLMTTARGDVFECLHLGWIQQPWLLGRDGWMDLANLGSWEEMAGVMAGA